MYRQANGNLMDNKIPINEFSGSIWGIPIFIAVGAPSSMAVEMSIEYGMTLIGFVKNDVASVYSYPSRVIIDQTF